MAAAIRKVALALAVPALLGGFAGTASAEPASFEGDDAATPADPRAFSCGVGNVCYYTGQDGTGQKCEWTNADDNHAAAPVVCSWAANTIVRSVFNNGRDPDFAGVCSYRNAGYDSRALWLRQGFAVNTNGTYRVMSHKWVEGVGLAACPD